MTHSARTLLFVLIVSNATTLFLVACLLAGHDQPQAFGQATSSGGGYVMATEQASDQSPVCFLLKTDDPPHLLIYKTDATGQLQLASSREIRCDLLLKDHHFPRGQVTGNLRTMPPVKTVCRAVKDFLNDPKKEEDEKNK